LALKDAAIDKTRVAALLNLVAVGFQRVRAQEALARAEAARDTEQFKSTLLDAVAHEFKTPLTSIKAASGTILRNRAAPSDTLMELATVIDEEATRLNTLVTDAIHLSRIEAGKVTLSRERQHVKLLIDQVIRQMEISLDGRPITYTISETTPSVSVD